MSQVGVQDMNSLSGKAIAGLEPNLIIIDVFILTGILVAILLLCKISE